MSYTSSDEYDYIDFRFIFSDLAKILYRFWLLILVLTSLAGTGGFLYKRLSYVPQYCSTATFFVDIRSAVKYEENDYAEKAMKQISSTFPYVIQSQTLILLVMEDMGVTQMPGNIRAVALSDTNLITIQTYAKDPDTSYALLQSVLKSYPRLAKKILGNTTMQMIGESGKPAEPANTDNAKGFAAICMAGCLAACFSLIFLYSIMRKTVRKEEDFNNILNITCLGSVPKVKLKKRSNAQNNLVLLNRRSVGYGFMEAIRMLRTRLERDQHENDAKVYLVSSTLSGEGKSTLAANIALSFAEIDKQVLLIDLDCRKPSICKALDMPNPEKGIIDVLENRCSIEEAAVDFKDNPNLRIISTGFIDSSIVRFLSHPKMKLFFNKASRLSDIVIIDTPPIAILSDAAAVSEYADSGIYVVSQDNAPVDRVREGIDMLSETGLRVSGCILNKTDKKAGGHEYRYGDV